MAEKIKLKAAGNGRASPLDTAMAVFAAASVAFATYVMPADLLARVIAISSQTGRAALSLVAAIATFAGVALLLRALSKPPGSRRAPVEVPNEPPRLRRADMHPDAPARTPILAGRELGVPLDDMAVDERADEAVDVEDVENVDYEAEWERPLPGFIASETDEADTSATVDEVAEVDAEPARESDLPFWVPDDASADEVVEEIEPAETSFEEPEVGESDEPPAVPFWAEASVVVDPEDEELVLDEPALVAQEEYPELDELGQRLPKKQALDHESIDGLVDRLETGVGRRKRATWTPSAPVSEEDRKLEERLRGAISDLRKMSRG
jgi:hypothetical protein